jgi:hypothetical protein
MVQFGSGVLKDQHVEGLDFSPVLLAGGRTFKQDLVECKWGKWSSERSDVFQPRGLKAWGHQWPFPLSWKVYQRMVWGCHRIQRKWEKRTPGSSHAILIMSSLSLALKWAKWHTFHKFQSFRWSHMLY